MSGSALTKDAVLQDLQAQVERLVRVRVGLEKEAQKEESSKQADNNTTQTKSNFGSNKKMEHEKYIRGGKKEKEEDDGIVYLHSPSPPVGKPLKGDSTSRAKEILPPLSTEKRSQQRLGTFSDSRNVENQPSFTRSVDEDESMIIDPEPLQEGDTSRRLGLFSRYKCCILFSLLIINIVSIPFTVKYGFASDSPLATTQAPTIAPTAYTGWYQLGNDIVAPPITFPGGSQQPGQGGQGGQEGQEDQAVELKFGWTVAVNAEATVIAVGSPGDGGLGRGSVFAYRLDTKQQKWFALGQALVGGNAGDAFGSIIALSENGLTLAVGSWKYQEQAGQVRVFQYEAGQWQAKGQPLSGQGRPGDVFGSAVTLSADGNIVAASAAQGDVKSIPDKERGADAGLVQVFRYSPADGYWEQMGQTLTGEASYDRFGYSLALSADGTILAVGVPYSGQSGGATWAGLVKIYKYHAGANEWIPLGQTLRPQGDVGRFGWSVDLSFDGTIVAVGAPLNDDNGEASGQLSVYKNVRENWELVGNMIQGQDLGRWFANTVILSRDGLMVAASLWGDQFWLDRIKYGGVRVFRLQGNRWIQVGGDLPGETLYDPYSTTVTMSAGGKIVMSGWDEETGSGVVRAYYAG